MKILGEMTTAALALVAVAGVAIAVIAIPDIRRYLRIRQM
ncbi:DUF6893 family small protein [Rhodococcus jostii]|uniref:Uncharacterized protein n=1 Tax=Rhodococcus jostii TaxID=132919 RepID=A0A1H5AD39_RHOJO|nr:hypothetical protein SAMN04490220_4393 [Rhodococcus jostii]